MPIGMYICSRISLDIFSCKEEILKLHKYILASLLCPENL